jgi:hypothetical protein
MKKAFLSTMIVLGLFSVSLATLAPTSTTGIQPLNHGVGYDVK